ncbi:hypothetical protein LTR95_009349 [Oleoguttula sp. CCFEE 5521]
MAAAAVETPIPPSPTAVRAPRSPVSHKSAGPDKSRAATYGISKKSATSDRAAKQTVKSRQARVEEEPLSSEGASVDWSARQPLPQYAETERKATDDTEQPAGELKDPVAEYEHPRSRREKEAANLGRKERGNDLSWQVADDLSTPITQEEMLEAERYQAAGRAAAATGEVGTARDALQAPNRLMISKAAVNYRHAWVRGKDPVLMRALQLANEELEGKGYGPRGTPTGTKKPWSVLLSLRLLDVIVLVTNKLEEWSSLVENGRNAEKAATAVVWAVQQSRTHLEGMELKWRQVVHPDFVDRLSDCFAQGLALQPELAGALQTVVNFGATTTQIELLQDGKVKKQLIDLGSPDPGDSDERNETAQSLLRTNQNMKGQNRIDNPDENDHIIPDIMIEKLLNAQPGDRQGVLRDMPVEQQPFPRAMASRAEISPIDHSSGRFTPVGVLNIGRMTRYIVNVGSTARGQEIFQAWKPAQFGNTEYEKLFADRSLNRLRFTEKLSAKHVVVDGICRVMTATSPRNEATLKQRRAKVAEYNEGQVDLDLKAPNVPRPPTYFRIQYQQGGTRLDGWMVRTDLIRAIGSKHVDGKEGHLPRLIEQHEALEEERRQLLSTTRLTHSTPRP